MVLCNRAKSSDFDQFNRITAVSAFDQYYIVLNNKKVSSVSV